MCSLFVKLSVTHWSGVGEARLLSTAAVCCLLLSTILANACAFKGAKIL